MFRQTDHHGNSLIAPNHCADIASSQGSGDHIINFPSMHVIGQQGLPVRLNFQDGSLSQGVELPASYDLLFDGVA